MHNPVTFSVVIVTVVAFFLSHCGHKNIDISLPLVHLNDQLHSFHMAWEVDEVPIY